jgi:hypothetical protein
MPIGLIGFAGALTGVCFASIVYNLIYFYKYK